MQIRNSWFFVIQAQRVLNGFLFTYTFLVIDYLIIEKEMFLKEKIS